jgi:hypothetical protein
MHGTLNVRSINFTLSVLMPHLNYNLKFCIEHTNIILTNSCNRRSRKLKASSIVHSTCLKISFKMALKLGQNI